IIVFHFELFGHGTFVFGSRAESTGFFASFGQSSRIHFDFIAHNQPLFSAIFSAFSRSLMSCNTFSMPYLSIIRMPLVLTRNLMKRFSVSNQKRCSCRFTLKRLRVLLLAWDTLFPAMGRFPVTWHTCDIDKTLLTVLLGHCSRQ